MGTKESKPSEGCHTEPSEKHRELREYIEQLKTRSLNRVTTNKPFSSKLCEDDYKSPTRTTMSTMESTKSSSVDES